MIVPACKMAGKNAKTIKNAILVSNNSDSSLFHLFNDIKFLIKNRLSCSYKKSGRKACRSLNYIEISAIFMKSASACTDDLFP